MRLHDTLSDCGNVFFRWRSYTPLLLVPLMYLERQTLQHPMDPLHNAVYEAVCVAVVFVGMLIRAATIGHIAKGTSGRNTKRQVASALNETGLYSIVRNPLYVGNYFIMLGVTLMAQSWAIAVINSFLFAAAYIPIILTEEEFLTGKFGERYLAYANRVPCFIPNPRLWRPADLPFSVRMVLRREHDTWMSSILGLVLFGLYRESMQRGALVLSHKWVSIGLVSLVVWLVFKAVKLGTGLLQERAQPA